MTGKPWPPAQGTLAKKLWAMGYTGAQIAKELEAKFKVKRSRSAVVGWLHRNGATQGDKPASKTALKRANAVKRGAEANRIRAKVAARAKDTPPPRLPIQRTTTPVASPNARHWTLRCDAIDGRECAYLVDGATTACCNPVDGGPGTFRQRYCTGHLGVVLDVEATAKYARRIPFAYEPSSVRRVPVVNGRATGWDEGRVKA